MKKSELKSIIRESVKELMKSKIVNEQLVEGPMGAAKACKKCLEMGCKCLVSGTSSEPTVECVQCPERSKRENMVSTHS